MSLLRSHTWATSCRSCARSLCTQAEAVGTATSVSEEADTQAHQQGDVHRLLEILSPLPSFGVGTRVSKAGWGEDCFWHVVDVSPIKRSFLAPVEGGPPAKDRLEAKVYGIKYWKGDPEHRIMKMQDIRKRVWRRVQAGEAGQLAGRVADCVEGRWDWMLQQGAKPAASAEGAEAAAIASV